LGSTPIEREECNDLADALSLPRSQRDNLASALIDGNPDAIPERDRPVVFGALARRCRRECATKSFKRADSCTESQGRLVNSLHNKKRLLAETCKDSSLDDCDREETREFADILHHLRESLEDQTLQEVASQLPK